MRAAMMPPARGTTTESGHRWIHFALALRRIEFESGRLMQAQICF
jgi:hypothetical protein